MDKEDVVHLHNGISFSHKKEWNNVICSNMDVGLEIILLSQVSQTKTDVRYHVTFYDIAYMWNLTQTNKKDTN